MEKVIFTDPELNEEIEFFVIEQTQINGIKYLLVAEDDAEDSCQNGGRGFHMVSACGKVKAGRYAVKDNYAKEGDKRAANGVEKVIESRRH